MVRQDEIVHERELHAAHDGVQTLRLGSAVLLVHEVRVVHDLGDLRQHWVLEGILLEECFEGAIVSSVGEPGEGDVEELCPLRGLLRILEESEVGLRIDEALDEPRACGAVDVATSAGCPKHQVPLPVLSLSAAWFWLSLTACLAALSTSEEIGRA